MGQFVRQFLRHNFFFSLLRVRMWTLLPIFYTNFCNIRGSFTKPFESMKIYLHYRDSVILYCGRKY